MIAHLHLNVAARESSSRRQQWRTGRSVSVSVFLNRDAARRAEDRHLRRGRANLEIPGGIRMIQEYYRQMRNCEFPENTQQIG